jgi:restriction endonuclease S subunit
MVRKNDLRSCTEVFTGYTFRLLPQGEEDGTIYFVQPKDIDAAGLELVYSNSLKISEFDGSARHFLRSGDLLVAGKGKSTPVLVFREEGLKVVSSSGFIVIRPAVAKVDPDYLGWYLQLPIAQNYFQASKTGATVLNLSVRSVQEFELELPAMTLQKKIGSIHQLALQQQRKQLALMAKQRTLFDHTMYQLVKE